MGMGYRSSSNMRGPSGVRHSLRTVTGNLPLAPFRGRCYTAFGDSLIDIA